MRDLRVELSERIRLRNDFLKPQLLLRDLAIDPEQQLGGHTLELSKVSRVQCLYSMGFD